MIANAWHHRSDALSSVPVVVGIGVTMLRPAWLWIDHVGAIVVSVFIFQAGWRIAVPALRELVDAGASRKEVERLQRIVLDTEGVEDVHAVRTRYAGRCLEIDLHILVDGGLTVQRGHDIAEAAKARLIAEWPDPVDVVIHLEPSKDPEPGAP
jgi:cation diffusion facilitator family transporter